ncbi:MAG: ATP-binding protein [Bacteroidia bacterium]|nr:ATP-binding protein [Bacteroidia bacterium]
MKFPVHILRLVGITLSILLIPGHTRASEADSLKTITWEALNQTDSLYPAYEALVYSAYTSNTSKSLYWAEKWLYTATKNRHYKRQSDAYLAIGSIYYFALDDYCQAESYMDEAILMLPDDTTTYQHERALILFWRSIVQTYAGKYHLAMHNQLAALRIAERLGDSSSLMNFNVNMGEIMLDQDFPDEALSYTLKAQAYLHHGRDTTDAVYCYTNLAKSYLKLQQTDSATACISRAYHLSVAIGYEYGKWYALGLRASLMSDNGNHSQAIPILDSVIQAFRRMQLKNEFCEFTIRKGITLNALGAPPLTLPLLLEAEKIAHDIGRPLLIREVNKALSDYFALNSQYEKAYQYLAYLQQYEDSLSVVNKLYQQSQLQSGYQYQQQLDQMAAQNTQQLRNIMIGVVILLILILSMLGWSRSRTLTRVNQQLSTLNHALKSEKERLASSNEDLQRFAHIISHDLKEPLRGVGSFATLLAHKTPNLDPEAQEYIGFISAGVKRMNRMMDDLMEYSTLGILDRKLEPVPFDAVLAETVQRISRAHEGLSIRINAGNLPTIAADRLQIHLLLYHLLDNAVKFRSNQLPTIQVSATLLPDQTYQFCISDNGIGMEQAYLDKIFGVFNRLHALSSNYEGSGVGLSICKKIIEQHEGTIWIESAPGQGTQVYFTLPQHPNV